MEKEYMQFPREDKHLDRILELSVDILKANTVEYFTVNMSLWDKIILEKGNKKELPNPANFGNLL